MKKMILFILLVCFLTPGWSYAEKKGKNHGCIDIGTLKTDGTGDNRTKKRGGNYASIALNTLNDDSVITVMPTSGSLKYVTLHARYEGGIWKTVYQGPITEFPVSTYLAVQKKDKRCTHAIVSINGAHEKYEPIACEAVVKVCAIKPDHKEKDCVDIVMLKTDGTGDNRTKKRGGNYGSIALDTLSDGNVITVVPMSGTLKYVTLHARYEGGIWKTVYQGPITEFPVSTYLAVQKKDKRCTHAILSINGAHEKYEPIACEAMVKVCGSKSDKKDNDCFDIGTLKTDGTGDKRTKKRGGNYASIAMSSLEDGQTITVIPESGALKYVALHARYDNGTWKTIYQGPVTEFPVSQYLTAYQKDKRCTNVIVSVNGAHETYEPVACTASVKVCGKKGKPDAVAAIPDWMNKETTVTLTVNNGQFVCAEGGGGGQVVANRIVAKEWETFTMIPLPGKNTVAFKAYNGQFVCAEGGGGREIVANRPEAREWETFTMVPMPGENKVAFKAYNGQFVCAEGGGGRELVANRPTAGEWETFTLSQVAKPKQQDKIALKAFNGQFVCAEGGGGREVVANRSAAKEWETFTLVKLPGDKKVALKAYNGQYVCAEGGGGREVVANRPEAREWETFTLVTMPGKDKIALKAYNGQFVSAESGGGRAVVANRPSAGDWETFTVVQMP